MKSSRSKRQCDICGHVHFCDIHHPARIENDPEFVLSVGVREHSKYLTQAQYITGLSPGVGKVPAVLMGTLQALTLMNQQQGQIRAACLFESLNDDISAKYGKRTEKRTARKNERRIGTLVSDPDPLYLTHRAGKVIALAGYRVMTDPTSPPQLRPVLMLVTMFFEAISEHPKAYFEYVSENDSLKLAEDHTRSAGLRKADSQQIFQDFDSLFAPHAVGFLRTINRQTRELVPA